MRSGDDRIRDIKETSVAIDTWDDIFSDFDPRPFDIRALSEDFIAELKKRYTETLSGSYLVTIYAPIALKADKTEKTVIQRLKRHFKHRALRCQKAINQTRARGAIFVASGILSLGLLTFITFSRIFSDLAIELLGIILMPLGWFGIWEGFSKIVDTSQGAITDEILFNQLSKASFRFRYIEEGK